MLKRIILQTLVVSVLCELACLNAYAGIKGGTVAIEHVKPIVFEKMDWQSPRAYRMVEALQLKDNRKFLVLNIELSVDWSDNDKATEHTILRKEIKLLDQSGEQMPLVGRHRGRGDLYDWLPSHIHLQRDTVSRYRAHLVFVVGADVSACRLQIEKAACPVEVPKVISKPNRGQPAKFRVLETAFLDEVPGAQLPEPRSLFEVSIKPAAGKILAVTIEILPLTSNRHASATKGFYAVKKAFNLATSDIGILFAGQVYAPSFAAQMGGKAYQSIGIRQTFKDQWNPITKTVYFFAPPDIQDFQLTYRKVPVTSSRIGSKDR